MSLIDTLLLIILFLPLTTTLTVLLIKGSRTEESHNAKIISLLSSVLNLLFVVYLYFNIQNSSHHFMIDYSIFKEMSINFSLSIDGVSLLFLLLTDFLFIIVFTFIDTKKFNKNSFILLLLLKFAVIGTFISFNLWMFYIFFELSVFLVFFVMRNTNNLSYAQYKFLIFNVLGSLIMFVCLICLITITGINSYFHLFNINLPSNVQSYLWWGFFIAFAIKSGIFPFHLWVKDIYSESEHVVNMILSGILIKFGIYGFLRIVIPAFPVANIAYESIPITLAVITIFYAMFMAFVVADIKSFIAYFSLSHVGVIVLGVFSLNTTGISGAIFQSISHSVFIIGLILIFMLLEKRIRISGFADVSGLIHKMPLLAFFFMIVILAGMSLPGTNGFIGEYLILQGLFLEKVNYAVIATFIVVFSAAVILTVYKRLVYGTVSSNLTGVKDLHFYEVLVFLLIIVTIIGLGLYPQIMLNLLSPYVSKVIGFIKSQEAIYNIF